MMHQIDSEVDSTLWKAANFNDKKMLLNRKSFNTCMLWWNVYRQMESQN